NDKDEISLLVTKLTYLLTHWIETGGEGEVPIPRQMHAKDALDLTISDLEGVQPSIIVGNPPFFKAARGYQVANRFLRKALDLLPANGIIGMIMPGGFLRT